MSGPEVLSRLLPGVASRAPAKGRARLPWIALAALVAGPLPLSAQGFDSPLVAPGRIRLEVTPSVTAFDSRFGLRMVDGATVEEVEPLGFDFSRSSVGPGLFPELQEDEDALAGALEGEAFRLSLGAARFRMDATSVHVPFRVDVGVTDWLTVGATVPAVKRRVETGFLLARAGANVGTSPVITDPGGPSSFLNQFVSGIGTVSNQADEICAADENDPACQEARALVDEANVFVESLRAGYSGSEFFFLEGSDEGRILTDRVTALQARMQEFGVSGFDQPPPLAEEALTAEEYATRFIDPVYGGGPGLPTGSGQSLWELGDVELSAAVRLLEHETVDSASGRPSFQARLIVGGLVRLPTATADTLRAFLDLDAYRAQTDYELRLFSDVRWIPKRLGARLDVRYGVQQSADVNRRIAAPDAVYEAAPSGVVSWTPGNYFEAEFAPRLFLTPEFALGALYGFYDRGADEYALLALDEGADPDDVDVSVLARETEARVQRFGVALTFSSVEANRAGETRFPFEVTARWETAFSGSGGRTPEAGRFVGGVRLFFDLWNR